ITGTNFAPGALVAFGGADASVITVVNGTTITALTPAHASGTVPVSVTNADAQSGTLSGAFTYVSPTAPAITGLSPGSGSALGGTRVTSTGPIFTPGATVNFGGALSTAVTVNDSTSLTALTPAHAAGLVPVSVTNPNNDSGTQANAFTYVSTAPTVSAVAPT